MSQIQVLDQNIETFYTGEKILQAKYFDDTDLSVVALTKKIIYLFFRSKKFGSVFENHYQNSQFACEEDDEFTSMEVLTQYEIIIIGTKFGKILFLQFEDEKLTKSEELQLDSHKQIDQIYFFGFLYLLSNNQLYTVDLSQEQKIINLRHFQHNYIIKFIQGYHQEQSDTDFLFLAEQKQVHCIAVNYSDDDKFLSIQFTLSDDQINYDACLQNTTSLNACDDIVSVGTKQGLMRWYQMTYDKENYAVDFELIEGSWNHAVEITSIAYDQQTLCCFSADKAGELTIFDVKNNKMLKRIIASIKRICSIQLSKSGVLLVASEDQSLKLYRIWCE